MAVSRLMKNSRWATKTPVKLLLSALVVSAPLLLSVSASASPAETATTWTELAADFAAAPNGATTTIELGRDISAPLNGFLTVPYNLGVGGAEIILDLAGHRLDVTQPGEDEAAIEVFEGAALHIQDSQGGGILTATGADYAAGIGVDYNVNLTSPAEHANLGAITIDSGTVNATGGLCGTGIGGAYYDGGGSVVINGGTVTATGGSDTPGIGNGCFTFETTQPMTITINGGVVTAVGGSGGSGIGWSYDSIATGGAIHVGGCATITATGGNGSIAGTGGGAGIGGGPAGPDGTVTPASDLRIDGVASPGSATTGASGQAAQGYEGAPGSPITYSGNSDYEVTAEASTPLAAASGGRFVLHCTRAPVPTTTTVPVTTVPVTTVPVTTVGLAATGSNSTITVSVAVGSLAVGSLAVGGSLLFRKRRFQKA